MIITLPCIRNPEDPTKALAHAVWRDANSFIYSISFKYDSHTFLDGALIFEDKNIQSEIHITPAGDFTVFKGTQLSKNNYIDADNIPIFPIARSKITLHTMIDRIDDIELFERWIRFYTKSGITCLSICINSKENFEYLSKIVNSIASRYTKEFFVYQCSLDYWVEKNKFHHVQHIFINLVAKFMIDSEYYLFLDTDEFVDLGFCGERTLYQFLLDSNANMIVFENNWCFLLNQTASKSEQRLIADMGFKLIWPHRSKYLLKKGSANQLGIHRADSLNFNGTCIKSEMKHIINLSTASSRPKQFKDIKKWLEKNNPNELLYKKAKTHTIFYEI